MQVTPPTVEVEVKLVEVEVDVVVIQYSKNLASRSAEFVIPGSRSRSSSSLNHEIERGI